MTFPSVSGAPTLTADQMREVDRIMIDDLGIGLVQMMENAGRGLSEFIRRRFSPESATVLVGSGGNGGGGMVAARHLANRGTRVTVTPVGRDRGPVPQQQAEILRRMDVALRDDPSPAEVVVDAVVGYSLKGDPHGRAAELIRWANDQQAPVVSLDIPSGLEPTTGHAGDPTIRAAATLTLALAKSGLETRPDLVGELYLADISVPPGLYAALGIAVEDPFAQGPIVRLA